MSGGVDTEDKRFWLLDYMGDVGTLQGIPHKVKEVMVYFVFGNSHDGREIVAGRRR